MRARSVRLGLLLVVACVFAGFGCGKAPPVDPSANQTPPRLPVANLPVPALLNAFPPAEPQLRGAVIGDLKPFSVTSPDFEKSLLTHPLPRPRLAFALPKNQTVQIELPRALDRALLNCWRIYLAHYYKVEMKPRGDLQARFNDDMAFAGASSRLDTHLKATIINAPNGLRKISWGECGDILRFLAQSAQSVVQQARDQTHRTPLS